QFCLPRCASLWWKKKKRWVRGEDLNLRPAGYEFVLAVRNDDDLRVSLGRSRQRAAQGATYPQLTAYPQSRPEPLATKRTMRRGRYCDHDESATRPTLQSY